MMLAVALSSVLAAQPSAARPPDAPATVQGVEDKDGVPGVIATFVVAQPASVVLEKLWSGAYATRIFPQVKRNAVLERSGNTAVIEVEAKAPLGSFVYRQKSSLARDAQGGGAIRWDRISGDMDVVRGGWIVTPVSETSCLVRYESYVALGPRLLYGVVKDQAVENGRTLAERVRSALAASAP
jgi:hypothetical protein